MTSRFQNCLVGMIIIITVGVILLPVLLNSTKNSKKSEFIRIPSEVVQNTKKCEINPILPVENRSLMIKNKSVAEETFANDISDSKNKLVDINSYQEQIELQSADKAKKLMLGPEKTLKSKIKIPHKNDYIIQLGVLKNAVKVEEIIARLRLSGYQVYSDPLLPVDGQLTKIFVGPNSSIEKLQSSLVELKNLTGLQGQMRNYKPKSKIMY